MKVGSKLTVLLVEDDDIDAEGIQRKLRKKSIGNTIVRAHDGIEALELLRANKVPKPYIILLDLQMPRMNGIEFLNIIRDDEQLSSSVIFILTTSTDENDIVSSYKKNIAGYFIKTEVGEDFSSVVDMLEGYWKISYMPR